jgi:regulator of protease activity HflC (stomatin/prohibitin superfamily)
MVRPSVKRIGRAARLTAAQAADGHVPRAVDRVLLEVAVAAQQAAAEAGVQLHARADRREHRVVQRHARQAEADRALHARRQREQRRPWSSSNSSYVVRDSE